MMHRHVSLVAKAAPKVSEAVCSSEPGTMARHNVSSHALLADRYLKAAGVTVPAVRADIVQESTARLGHSANQGNMHVFDVRILAAVERVLCERLGADPGTNTTNQDTARRRLLFSINPTYEAQIALLRNAETANAMKSRRGRDLIRIPAIIECKPMIRQAVAFPAFPWQRHRGGQAADTDPRGRSGQ